MSTEKTAQSDSVSVRFWGVRGSIPTPGPATIRYGGNTSCVEVRLGDQVVIFDAGTGIRLLGDSLMKEFEGMPIEVSMLISHTHWDHIQGLPFFAPAYQSENCVRIYGFEGAKRGLESVLWDQMESPHFPIQMTQMVGDVTVNELNFPEFQIGEVTVRALQLNHPGGSTGFRLERDGCVVVYVPDNEPVSYLAENSTVAGASDGRDPNQALIDFVRGADVAIMDAQYDAAEYPSHVGWGHGCVDDVVRIAAAGQVQQLALFHHDPNHDDQWMDSMVQNAEQLAESFGSSLQVRAAREGGILYAGKHLPQS
jgi:phosphoribosyl 1,2-cyclic phosphodiesterase